MTSKFRVENLLEIYHMLPDNIDDIVEFEFWKNGNGGKSTLLQRFTLLDIIKLCGKIKSNFKMFQRMCNDYEKSHNAKQNIVEAKIGESLLHLFCGGAKREPPSDIVRSTPPKIKQIIEPLSLQFVQTKHIDYKPYHKKTQQVTRIDIVKRFTKLDLKECNHTPICMFKSFNLKDSNLINQQSEFSTIFKSVLTKIVEKGISGHIFTDEDSKLAALEAVKESLHMLSTKYGKTRDELYKMYQETCGSVENMEKMCRGMEAIKWNYLEDIVLASGETERIQLLRNIKGSDEVSKRMRFLGIK